MSIVVQHRLHIIGNKRFPKNLFPDAWLTKDGVALLPVHRVILAPLLSTIIRFNIKTRKVNIPKMCLQKMIS